MAINRKRINQAYSPDKPLQNLAQEVVVAQRAPVSAGSPSGDKATIGQIWCDIENQNAYILTGFTAGASVWTQIDNTGGGGSFTSLTVNPGPTDLTGTVFFRTADALDAIGLLKTSNTAGTTQAGLQIENVAGGFSWYVRNDAQTNGRLLLTYESTNFVELRNDGDTFFNGGTDNTEKLFQISNDSNTADAGVRLRLSTNNTSGTGDIVAHFINQGQLEWAMGYDRSATQFVLSRGTGTLGTNNVWAVNSSGVMSIPNGPLNLPLSTAASVGVITAAGSRYIHNFSTSNNSVFMGINAGNLTNTSNRSIGIGGSSLLNIAAGNDNIAIGDSALTTVAAGSGNVAVGTKALEDNDSDNNTAVGASSLQKTTNSQNSAVGYRSLFEVTSGTRNAALGYLAGGGANVNDCVFIGHNAQATGTGTQNTHIGSSAGLANDGNDCVSVGMNTLIANNAGSSTAVGFGAAKNATAVNTTAVGWQALGSAGVTGENNVGVGYAAGQSVTSGKQNTYVGTACGSANTSTDNSTAMGFNALNKASGASNTALGASAGKEITAGQRNTFVGSLSGPAIAGLVGDTSENTTLGYSTLNLATSGTLNTGIGSQSLRQLATGSFNTALGYKAGDTLTTTDSSNIMIRNIGAAGLNNTIRIGTFGTGDGEQNNADIIGGLQVDTSQNVVVPVGNLTLTASGKHIEVKGGLDADFIGNKTLSAGTTGPVNNANIAANDRIFVTRTAVGGTPGFLSVSINPGVSFTITSSNALDTSSVNYFIVRQGA